VLREEWPLAFSVKHQDVAFWRSVPSGAGIDESSDRRRGAQGAGPGAERVPKKIKELNLSPSVLIPVTVLERMAQMGRYLLLWLLGVPIPILLLIWLFGGLH
jgi:hypothetical protein